MSTLWNYNLQEMINAYSYLGLPAVILIASALIARFVVRG